MKSTQEARLPLNAGITLVEILIAVSLGAVAAAVLFATLIGGQDVFIKTRAEAGAHGDAQAVLGLLANEIRAAGSDAGELGLPGAGIALARGDTLHIVSDLNGDRVISLSEPPEDVLYVFNSGEGQLTRDIGTGPVVLLDRVSNLVMTFLDENGQQLAPEANGRIAPDAVRAVQIVISIQTPNGSVEDVEGVYAMRIR